MGFLFVDPRTKASISFRARSSFASGVHRVSRVVPNSFFVHLCAMLLALSDDTLTRVVRMSCTLVSSGHVANVSRALNGITRCSTTWTGLIVDLREKIIGAISWPRLHQQLTLCDRVNGTDDQLEHLCHLAHVQIFTTWSPRRPFDVHTAVHINYSGLSSSIISKGAVLPHVGVTLRWTGALSALTVGMTTASTLGQLSDAYFRPPQETQYRFYHCLFSLVPFSASERWPSHCNRWSVNCRRVGSVRAFSAHSRIRDAHVYDADSRVQQLSVTIIRRGNVFELHLNHAEVDVFTFPLDVTPELVFATDLHFAIKLLPFSDAPVHLKVLPELVRQSR